MSLFSKRKNNAGRILPQWIFGGRHGSENIEEGSIIFSDCWKGYRTEELEEAGFEHFKVNHKYSILDPDDPNVHTQTVERIKEDPFEAILQGIKEFWPPAVYL
uniref:Transposase n=1 Tax=Acrobeloides nanus TaxID=290746 RepID=A0A914E676_9BILA